MAKTNEDSMLFPQKLMEILTDPENQKAISWLPSGTAFVIHDRDMFAESVMPKYFSRQAKYSSFTRKLNRWYVPCNTYGAPADFISASLKSYVCFSL